MSTVDQVARMRIYTIYNICYTNQDSYLWLALIAYLKYLLLRVMKPTISQVKGASIKDIPYKRDIFDPIPMSNSVYPASPKKDIP